MVLQRTLNTIEAMKERPHEERRVFAMMIAIGVVAILFIGWGFLFYYRLTNAAASVTTSAETPAAPASNPESAAAAASAYWAQEGAVASSTDGYVDLAPVE